MVDESVEIRVVRVDMSVEVLREVGERFVMIWDRMRLKVWVRSEIDWILMREVIGGRMMRIMRGRKRVDIEVVDNVKMVNDGVEGE